MTFKEEVEIYEELAVRAARKHLKPFSTFMMPNFDWQFYHNAYYEVLDLFAKKKLYKLIITMPPQHGKSQGSTRFLPSYILGLNPDTKIAVCSYNSTIARKFNRDNQRIIDTPEYNRIFPNTTLNDSNVVTVSSNYLRNSEEFEIVGHKGTLKAVGRGGALTSITVDVAIMDDLYKDYAEGNSPVIREAALDWYTSVVKTRLHNESQQLIVFTRWHEDDIIGHIEKTEPVQVINTYTDLKNANPKEWVKINFEAIKESLPTELDPRNKGEALWEAKHSIVKLELERKLDPNKFNCLYQGDPSSSDGLLYTATWREYDEVEGIVIKKSNYTDIADKGTDYFCSVNYDVVKNGDIYVKDIYYTQESMEKTEQGVIDFLNKSEVLQADFEGNNGGRFFALNINRNVKAVVNIFNQNKNKESRILTNAAIVQSRILMPKNWASKYPIFWKHLTKFKRDFKSNNFDDAPDTITGIIEKNPIGYGKSRTISPSPVFAV